MTIDPSGLTITRVRFDRVYHGHDGLLAFAVVTFNGVLAVRDLRIMDTPDRGLIVRFPVRPFSDQCPHCANRNRLQTSYCNHCGGELDPNRRPKNKAGNYWIDAAYVEGPEAMDTLTRAVLDAYRAEFGPTARATSARRVAC